MPIKVLQYFAIIFRLLFTLPAEYTEQGLRNGRASVRWSVHLSYDRQQQRRAASLLLSAPWEEEGYVDRQTTALSSKCGQRHVVSHVQEAEHRLVTQAQLPP